MEKPILTGVFFMLITAMTPALAADDPAVTACKSTGLIALKQKSPDITDVIIDPESLAVSAKADTRVEDVNGEDGNNLARSLHQARELQPAGLIRFVCAESARRAR